MAKKLSFIIPVYNVEAYLPQCLDSILSQCGGDCETILVDDGTQDASNVICDAYSLRYPNVKVIHKPNGGLSSARNAGFELAEGRYVCFVDSDDYIEPGTAEKLLAWIESYDADICFLQASKVYPDGTSESLGECLSAAGLQGKGKTEALDYLSSRPKFPASAWAKLYRRAFLEENGLRFPDDRRLSEDLPYSLNAFLTAETFDVLEFPFYCYRQNRAGSITNSVNAKYYFDTAGFVTETAGNFGAGQTAAGDIQRYALAFAAYEYAILLWEMVLLTGEDREKAMGFLREYRWVLRYGRTGKIKLVNAVVSLLGLKNAAKLLNVYMNSRR